MISQSSNLADLLWAVAHETPARVAIEDASGECTYDALRHRAGSVAGSLALVGIEPGDRIGILLERGASAAAALFGVHAAGAVAVVINERMQPRQIEYMLRQCSARALITQQEVLQRHARPLVTDATLVDVGQLQTGWKETPIPRAAGDFAQIIYTSGSSGLPKGVTFTHDAIAAGVSTCVSYLGLRRDDRVASLLPFSSVYGLNQLVSTVAVGATLVVEPSVLWNDVANRLRERRVTVLAAVPPLWLQLLAAPVFVATPPESLRIVQNAGGHLPVTAVRRIRELLPNARLFLQYGQTETFRSSYLDPHEVDEYPDSIGRAIPGAAIFVIKDDGTECGPNEEGELVFRGPSMATGYWGDPQRSLQTFRPGPQTHSGQPGERVVFSGDRARRDGNGRLYFVARDERMIKTMGFRVGPDEVVDVLLASGKVREAVITAEPDARRGERIVAHIVLKPECTVRELHRFCKAEMPSHMVPARLEIYDMLPCLATGKYDVTSLRSPSSHA